MESKKVELTETVEVYWGWGNRRDIGQNIQIFNYTVNTFWRSNIQHGDI